MNLIRNSGFEVGDTRFWEMTSGVSFAVDSANQKYGTYSGKLSMTGVSGGAIQSGDYLEVRPYQIVDFSAQVLASSFDGLYVYIQEYTEDLEYIGTRLLYYKVLPATWTNIKSQVRIGGEVCYARLRFYVDVCVSPTEMYFDSVIFNTVEIDDIPVKAIELCNLSNLTASGDTSSDVKDLYGFRDYYADIDVTSVTGTNPTCDVTICEFDMYGNLRVLGTFTQFNGVTDQRVGIAPPITGDMYVKYVMGGTVTDCDFKVSVIGVR